MEDIARDPHIKERGSIASIYDPSSKETLSFPGLPIRLWPTPGEVRFPGLPMGSANEVILGDLLGYSAEEIAELKTKGII